MNDAHLQKRRKFIIDTVYVLLIALLVIGFVRWGLPVLAPFVFGLIVAMILRPVIRFFSQKCRFKRGIATVVSLVLFYCTIGVLLVFIAVELYSTGEDLIRSLPSFYTSSVAPALAQFSDTLENAAKSYFPDFVPIIDETIDSISASVASFVSRTSVSILSYVANSATKLPRLLLNTLISIISSFFIALDYIEITRFILRQLSSHTRTIVLRVKNELGSTLIKYIKSYSLIIVWTFMELWAGLSIIGVNKAALIALVIAVFDILPVIGSGLFLIPWAIISLVIGNIPQGIGIALLYLFVTVMRNIIEPRIVGTQVGLAPIVTLMAMVVGTFLFGGIGLLGLPVSLAIIKSLNDQGFIHLYRDVSDAQEDEKKKDDLIGRLLSFLRGKKKSGQSQTQTPQAPTNEQNEANAAQSEKDVL